MSKVLNSPIVMSNTDMPTREGERVSTLNEIFSIPTPRVGMIVYVEDEEHNYVITSLQNDVVNGVTVPNGKVKDYKKVDAEALNEVSLLEEKVTNNANEIADAEFVLDELCKAEKPNVVLGKKINDDGSIVDADNHYAVTEFIESGFFIEVSNNVEIYANKFTKDGVLSEVNKWHGTVLKTPKDANFKYQLCLSKSVMSNGFDNVEKVLDSITDFKVFNSIGAKRVVWNVNSNMNDFTVAGVYDIYGERTMSDDNLPIDNTGGGHSIAARLTVVASTLQPANNEICITQFLQLSNRVGGEGATYVRTYNENNNGMNGWSPWQKQMGMVETLINSNDTTVGQEIFSGTAQKIGDGLNGMIDNGMYSGIYIDNLFHTGVNSLYYLSAQPTFVETFVLVVINDYAASGKLNLPRHITQLKYAVDAITGESTVKKRVGTGNNSISWGAWEILNKNEITSMISEEIKNVTEGIDPDKIDSIKDIVAWIDAHGGGVTAIYNAIEAEKQRAIAAEDVLQKGIDAQGVALEKEKSALVNGSTIVGQAREVYSLTGKTDDDNFLIRTTAGRNTIGDGVASIKKIGGNIVKNLVNFSKGVSSPNASITYINGVLKMTPKTEGEIFGVSFLTPIVEEHKYYGCCTIYIPLEDTVVFFPTGGTASAKRKQGLSFVSLSIGGSPYNSSVIRIGNTNNPPQNNVCYIFNYAIIDLTEMFGAGNEPDQATCDRLFGTMDALPQGLTVAKPTAFKSVGYNQFNPENVLKGKTIDENGAIVDSTTTDIAIVPCLPCKVGVGENNGYCIHGEFEDSDIKVYFTPLNPMEVEGELYMHELTPDATKGTYVPLIKGYMLIVTPSTHNLCCHFLWGEDRDKHAYEPYVESVVELPEIPQMSEWGLAGIQSSGTLVCDEIDSERGVYVKRIGRLNGMDKLIWYKGTGGLFYSQPISGLRNFSNTIITDAGYTQGAYKDGTISITEGCLYLWDSSIESTDKLKELLKDKTLYYHLRTVEEYPIPTKALNYIGSDYGTEQFVGTKVPLNANTLYYMRSLVGETRNFLDKMYNNTNKKSANEVADYITNGIEENKAKAEEAPNLALRSLFIAAGAEYNDTDVDTTKKAPWGETVTHKAGHYYLNGLGDITAEQMLDIYNFKGWEPLAKGRRGLQKVNLPRTLLLSIDQLQFAEFFQNFLPELCFYYNLKLEVIPFANKTTNSPMVLFVNNNVGTQIRYYCGYCPRLRYVGTIGVGFVSNFGTGAEAAFYYCSKLEYVYLYKLKASITLEWSPLLHKDSVLYMIKNAAPTSAITITLHPDAYARLAEDAEIVAALEAQPLITLVTAE